MLVFEIGLLIIFKENIINQYKEKSLVKKAGRQVENHIGNEIYNTDLVGWWQKDSPFFILQYLVNPVRTDYFKNKFTLLNINPQGKNALEIGCGGGLFSEELARMGFNVTGIDPAECSLKTAVIHARSSGLAIDYRKGAGEKVPFPDNSADIVFCCDVLEHVCSLPKVIAEIHRVLKPGGLFCYDTLNRTLLSKLIAIKNSAGLEALGFCAE